MFEDLLAKIGFSQNEAKLYLELLSIGSQPVSVIAKRACLNRSTSYSILRSLKSKGVVTSFVKAGVSYFSACDPNSLVAYIDGQCRTFDYHRGQFLSLIPQLRTHRSIDVTTEPLVSCFEGVDGVKSLLSTIFALNSNFTCYLSPGSWESVGLTEFCFAQLSKLTKSFSLEVLLEESPVNYNFCHQRLGDIDCKFLSDPDLFLQDIYVFNSGVAIFDLSPGNLSGILIKSFSLAKMQLAIFNKLYLKSFNERN